MSISFARAFSPPCDSIFIFGPRGVGKSTWVKNTYTRHQLIDLLLPNEYRLYHSYPERLEAYVLAHADNKTFVIGEIQKVPALLSVVHRLIEMKRGWQFILTGSSARKLKRSGVDLLAGRALLTHMHPFMASEIPTEFQLEKNIELGMLPLVLASASPRTALETYIAIYLQEEVKAESLVRHVDAFGRFLELMSFSQASTVNISNIARDCQVSRNTVENYILILEDLLLAIRLPVFQKRAKRDLVTSPKFYYFDCGVYQSIRPQGPLENKEAINGHALETLVMQHLRAWCDYSEKSAKLFFWQSKGGLEVDFVIYGELGFYAIEVKLFKTIKPKELRGLKEFKHDYPEANCFFLYLGSEKIMQHDILCMPLSEFLLTLKPNLPIAGGVFQKGVS